MFEEIKRIDPELSRALEQELDRQEYEVNLIASENYASKAVLDAQGCLMTNKYAEGYPGKRYYGGCQFVDIAEDLARERAKALFGADHVNVQPHSGTQANMAVYYAVLEHGDTILSMNLAHGGHLSHGHFVNFSGQQFNIVSYNVNETDHLIDYDMVLAQAKKHKPRLILCGASAYPRFIDFKRFREIADEVGAMLMADIAHIAGLVAARLHPDPIPYCDFVTTTTHKTLRGPRGGMVFCKAINDYPKKLDKTVMPGIQGGPLMHVIAAKAVALKEAMTEQFKKDQQQTITNAKKIAEMLMQRGYKVLTGGTDNHLLLVDLRNKKISGRDAETVLGKAGINLNRNLIPYDPEKPLITSGIRIGTPCVTTRGMKEEEMVQIADLIDRAISNRDDDEILARIKAEVKDLCSRFPMYVR